MPFEFETPGVTAEILAARTAEALDPILTKLTKSASALGAPTVRGHKLFVKGLDDTIPHIARTLRLDDREGQKSNDNVCVIATQLYGVGGHSKVVADITRLIGGEKVSLILTDLYGNIAYRRLIGQDLAALGYHCRTLLALKAPSVLDRTVELYRVLCAIRPTRIFLLHHHMDVCAVAATYPFRDVTEFVHHADHLPSLGATVAYSAHADLTYTCYLACREAGLPATYVAMTLPDLDTTPREAKAPGRLRLATCGSLGKYRNEGRESLRRWTDWVVPALQIEGAEIVHIGPWDEALRDDIHGALTAAGLDPGRYVFLGPAPSLQAALLEQQVDIYLGSYPEVGARAILEAMAVRIPAIVPIETELGPLLTYGSPVPGWAAVHHPDELAAAIAAAAGRAAKMADPAFGDLLAEEMARFETYVATPA